MSEEISKNKLKLQDIINELDNLKKYNSELANNSKGKKLEDYLNSLDKSITIAQNKAETIYDEINK